MDERRNNLGGEPELRKASGSALARAGGRVLLVVATMAGCASQPPADEGPHPVWPAPPAPPRVIHRRTIRGAEQLARPSFFDQIGTLIAGRTQHRIAEPNCVAVRTGELLAVTDQQAQGVHVFELKTGRSRFIDHVGETYFVSPVGVAIGDGFIAVADSALNRVYLLRPDGGLIRELKKPDGFVRATALAYDARNGYVYVADTGAHVVYGFDPEGGLARTVGGPGGEPGRFNCPTHLCIDRDGRLLVTDSLNFRVQVFDADGRYRFDLGGHGDATGHFGVPKGVAVDSHGHIYVVDSYFSNVQVFDGRGRFLLTIGQPGKAVGRFDVPVGIAIDADDRIYVADSQNRRVQVFQYVGAETEQQ